MQQTILEPCEVVRYASLSPEYPTRNLCDLIAQVEEGLANTCIGFDFYQSMLNDLTDKAGYVVAKPGVKYLQGAIIQYECEYYEALQDDVTIAQVNDVFSFAKLKKFVDADNQLLYEKYLRRIIALKVYAQSLTEATIKVTAGGAIVNQGDTMGNRTANRQELSALKDAALTNAKQAIENMYVWIERQKAQGKFEGWGKCGVSCENATQNVRFRKRFLV
jgi:hypothetical protein